MNILEKLGLKKIDNTTRNEQADLKSRKIGEFILPDGRFASIHEIKYLHIAASQNENEYVRLANLLSFTVTIDDAPLSVAEIMNMPHRIVKLLLAELNSQNESEPSNSDNVTLIPTLSDYGTDVESLEKYTIALNSTSEDVCAKAFIEGQADGAYCLYLKSSGEKKQSMLRCAAALGHPLAQNDLAMQLDRTRNQESGMEIHKLIKASAKYGIPHAQVSVGWWHMTGEYGFLVDYYEAMKWNSLAYDQGHSEGANNIGELYEKGNGVPADIELAKYWYHKAAQLGNTEAAKKLRELNDL